METISLSQSSLLAWKIANELALRNQSDEIKLSHLYLAILSMLDNIFWLEPWELEEYGDAVGEIRRLRENAKSILKVNDDELTRLRRKLFKQVSLLPEISESSSLHRSRQTLAAFRKAMVSADKENKPVVTMIDLLRWIDSREVEKSLLTNSENPEVPQWNDSEAGFQDPSSDYFSHSPVLSHSHVRSQNIQSDELIRPAASSQTEIEQLFGELNSMIGLERVKNEVRQLMQFVKVQDMRRKRGLGTMDISLHSVFMGTPGTGKTTVARIYGKMLKALGLLDRGHLVETDRSGLVANYIGQTANKTDAKVSEAMEAFYLSTKHILIKGDHAEWDYGSEAIEVLMKRMEDHRSELAIIVAGYPEPMKKFLNSNEGFKSRFVNYIHFEDYTPEELIAIFKSLCSQNSYVMQGNSMELAKIYLESAYMSKDEGFGNAREVRNFFEMIIRNQALRIGETARQPSVAQLKSIEPQDVYPLLNSETR